MALEDDLRIIMQRELAPGVDDLAHFEAMETHDLLATYANREQRHRSRAESAPGAD